MTIFIEKGKGSRIWDADGKQIEYDNLIDNITQTNLLSDFNIAGEYRVIVNPSLGDNDEFVCHWQSPCIDGLSNQLVWCDAVYDDC